jgi:hypothetical protein
MPAPLTDSSPQVGLQRCKESTCSGSVCSAEGVIVPEDAVPAAVACQAPVRAAAHILRIGVVIHCKEDEMPPTKLQVGGWVEMGVTWGKQMGRAKARKLDHACPG